MFAHLLMKDIITVDLEHATVRRILHQVKSSSIPIVSAVQADSDTSLRKVSDLKNGFLGGVESLQRRTPFKDHYAACADNHSINGKLQAL